MTNRDRAQRAEAEALGLLHRAEQAEAGTKIREHLGAGGGLPPRQPRGPAVPESG